MKVELIDTLGSDLTVVNAARVSFNKHHASLHSNDERLIRYLAKHGHWTPFGHPQLQFRIVAPVFVARQLVKHQVGLVWNEVSRRYVEELPTFFSPEQWRERALDKKQGSGEGIIAIDPKEISEVYDQITGLYKSLIERGVAPEQARIVLPQSMYTEWYWTGSLYAFARVCNLRLGEDAQEETQLIAESISDFASQIFPISWKYLIGNSNTERKKDSV